MKYVDNVTFFRVIRFIPEQRLSGAFTCAVKPDMLYIRSFYLVPCFYKFLIEMFFVRNPV